MPIVEAAGRLLRSAETKNHLEMTLRTLERMDVCRGPYQNYLARTQEDEPVVAFTP